MVNTKKGTKKKKVTLASKAKDKKKKVVKKTTIKKKVLPGGIHQTVTVNIGKDGKQTKQTFEDGVLKTTKISKAKMDKIEKGLPPHGIISRDPLGGVPVNTSARNMHFPPNLIVERKDPNDAMQIKRIEENLKEGAKQIVEIHKKINKTEEARQEYYKQGGKENMDSSKYQTIISKINKLQKDTTGKVLKEDNKKKIIKEKLDNLTKSLDTNISKLKSKDLLKDTTVKTPEVMVENVAKPIGTLRVGLEQTLTTPSIIVLTEEEKKANLRKKLGIPDRPFLEGIGTKKLTTKEKPLVESKKKKPFNLSSEDLDVSRLKSSKERKLKDVEVKEDPGKYYLMGKSKLKSPKITHTTEELNKMTDKEFESLPMPKLEPAEDNTIIPLIDVTKQSQVNDLIDNTAKPISIVGQLRNEYTIMKSNLGNWYDADVDISKLSSKQLNIKIKNMAEEEQLREYQETVGMGFNDTLEQEKDNRAQAERIEKRKQQISLDNLHGLKNNVSHSTEGLTGNTDYMFNIPTNNNINMDKPTDYYFFQDYVDLSNK